MSHIRAFVDGLSPSDYTEVSDWLWIEHNIDLSAAYDDEAEFEASLDEAGIELADFNS